MSISAPFKSTPRSTLKNLVETLHDGQMGFRKAAEGVTDPKLKELFDRFSLQRSKFAGELESELLSIGEKDPEKEGGTVAGAVHRGWIDIKSALMKQDNHAVLSEAERGEDVAKKAYKEALEQENITGNLRQIISTQAAAIQKAHDEVKMLRDSTAKK